MNTSSQSVCNSSMCIITHISSYIYHYCRTPISVFKQQHVLYTNTSAWSHLNCEVKEWQKRELVEDRACPNEVTVIAMHMAWELESLRMCKCEWEGQARLQFGHTSTTTANLAIYDCSRSMNHFSMSITWSQVFQTYTPFSNTLAAI